MNRFPRYRLPHSLHTPFLHFDLITRPPPLLPFFLSFSSFFLPFHQPFFSSLLSILDPLDSGSSHSLGRKNREEGRTPGIAGPLISRESPLPLTLGTSGNLGNAFQLRTRRPPDTSYLYDQEFRATPSCFPGEKLNRLSFRGNLFVQGKGRFVGFIRGRGKFVVMNFLMIFLNERTVFGGNTFERTIVRSYRTRISNIREHSSTVPLRVRWKILSILSKKERKEKGIYMVRQLFFLLTSREYSSIKVVEKNLFIFYK